MSENNQGDIGLKPYVPVLGAFALAVGTAIGWGSVIVTNSSYLLKAGPIGSVQGMILGAVVMLVIARNYNYMMNEYPESGGVYTYVKNVFGYDRAFLISWFLVLTYLAMLWANATSVPLFARYFIGDIFTFGYLYTRFGSKVYLGEILITIAALLIIGSICRRSKVLAIRLMSGTVLIFTAGITVCFIASVAGGGSSEGFEPGFLPDSDMMRQVIAITFITPWAFVGFESISHSVEEFSFPRSKTMNIFRAAILVTTVLYILILLMSVTAYPEEYGSWLEYIGDLDNLDGIKALPAFYVANHYMGSAGVGILMMSLVGLVLSSLIGNTISLSRLLYALSRDRIIPGRFSKVNSDGLPYKAVTLVMLLSLPIPFIGRTAVGWIVDVTTIGATLVYGFISAAVISHAKLKNDQTMKLFGTAGIVIMLIFGINIVVTSIIGAGAIGLESQLIFIVWSVLGLIYFRFVMVRDHGRRFGKNLTVWIVLVLIIFVLTMLLVSEKCVVIASDILVNVRNTYDTGTDIDALSEDQQLYEYFNTVLKMIIGAAASIFAILLVPLATMFSNWMYIKKCEEEASDELGKVKSMAYRDPLTGVKSKHAFVEYQTEIDYLMKSGKAEDFALLVCDVNGLKYVNDTLGHEAGDKYIQAAAKLICVTFEHSPVFRTGGDEFVVIINGTDYPNRKELTAEFDKKAEENISTGQVVVSCGMAEYIHGDSTTFHDLFENADKLMYARKNELKSIGAVTRD